MTQVISGISNPSVSTKKFVVVGDLQRTSFLEKIIGRESNDNERELIINEIANIDPAFMVIVGDLVFDGSSSSHWKEFDELIKPVTEKNIPIYPVLGNHDYWGSNSSALENFSERFIQFKETYWYEKSFDSLALIFLDSNIDDLTSAEWQNQKQWFETKLKQLDEDNSIIGIIVFLHHPPYTNSKVTTDEEHVKKTFVQAFERSTKTLAMITGHAHVYERFLKNGKTYIVSGGGGGPRVDLKAGVKSIHRDLLVDDPDSTAKRPFNFLVVNRSESGIEVKVMGLLKDSSKFFELEEIIIPDETIN
ncbi:MAG: metallophosphoesterase [Ignavibacteriales bacterium]|nr:MAG: metallophosphoesterase [Ignavibacteriales bacterium]